ncbi:MAG: CUB domain-containing protein, partial [Dolichospermum sp.]
NNTLIGLAGTITDGQGNYSNFQRCSWLINPPGVNTLTLQFLDINMESCCDFVDVFEGPDSTFNRIGRFTGTTIPPTITVPGGVAWVRFTTDVSLVFSGFSLNYNGFNCPNGPAIPTIVADGPTTFRTGGSVVLRTNPVAGVSYIWSNGSTADTLRVTTSGLYRLRAVANGCTTSFSAPIGVSVLT